MAQSKYNIKYKLKYASTLPYVEVLFKCLFSYINRYKLTSGE